MIKQIIPEILHNTKFKKQTEDGNSCSYNYTEDLITFNRTKIRQEENINNDIREYFGKNYSMNEILLISLLHELGHRFRGITKLAQPISIINEERLIYDNSFKKHTPYYYLLIKEEREAMKLAKQWFDKIKRIK